MKVWPSEAREIIRRRNLSKAKEILDERLAKGEINLEEHDKLKSQLDQTIQRKSGKNTGLGVLGVVATVVGAALVLLTFFAIATGEQGQGLNDTGRTMLIAGGALLIWGLFTAIKN